MLIPTKDSTGYTFDQLLKVYKHLGYTNQDQFMADWEALSDIDKQDLIWMEAGCL